MILNEYDSIYSGEQVDLGIARALKLPDNVDKVLVNVERNSEDINVIKSNIDEYVATIEALQKQLDAVLKVLEDQASEKSIVLDIYEENDVPEAPEEGMLRLFACKTEQGYPELKVINSEGISYPIGQCELQATAKDNYLHLEIKEVALK